MSPGLFGANANAVKLFEIRLDNNVVVLRGSEEEASSQLLKGTLVLCLSEPMPVKNIRMEFVGESRVAWPDPRRAKPVKKETVFFLQEFTFKDAGKGKTETLEMGNYEFPFEVLLPGDSPESVEGLYDCWIMYRMKATVTRGRLTHKLHARKHLRVVRTLDPSALELSHATSVENIWPDKLEYAIIVPCKAAVFGTCIQMEFTLIPILKGLQIGKIFVQLCEAQEFVLYDQVHSLVREVARAEYNIPEGFETLGEDQEGFHLKQRLALPRTLSRCVQDVDCKGMKVRHKLIFHVQLHNPDGHLSELRASLPIYIFISPHLPLGEDNNIVDINPNDPQTLEALGQHAPPLYGEHEFDLLWDHLDPNGYMTPVGSSSDTNSPFHTRSPNQSSENLDPTANAASGLRDRLRNLPDPSSSFWPSNAHSDNNPPSPARSDSDPRMSASHTRDPDQPSNSSDRAGIHRRSSDTSHTNSLSRTSSAGGSSPRTPELVEMDVNELSKVPSYTTALRSTARTPLRDDLPTYFSATSFPPSPPARTPCVPGQTSSGLQRRHSTENSTSSSSPAASLSRTALRSTLSTRSTASDDRERNPGPLQQVRSTAH